MELQHILKKKWVIILMIFSWLVGILPSIALIIFLLSPGYENKTGIFHADMFFRFYSNMFLFLVLFTGYVAAKNVTSQKVDRSISLYLCRPITKIDYILIKFSVLSIILTVAIILPDILLFVVTLGLLKMPFGWNIEHLWILGSILLFGAIIVVVYSLMGVAIALSSKKTSGAIAGIYIFLFLTVGLVFVMRYVLGNDYLILLSPWDVLDQVGAPLFSQALPYDVPWALSFAALMGFVSISVAMLIYNINRVEVVG